MELSFFDKEAEQEYGLRFSDANLEEGRRFKRRDQEIAVLVAANVGSGPDFAES